MANRSNSKLRSHSLSEYSKMMGFQCLMFASTLLNLMQLRTIKASVMFSLASLRKTTVAFCGASLQLFQYGDKADCTSNKDGCNPNDAKLLSSGTCGPSWRPWLPSWSPARMRMRDLIGAAWWQRRPAASQKMLEPENDCAYITC